MLSIIASEICVHPNLFFDFSKIIVCYLNKCINESYILNVVYLKYNSCIIIKSFKLQGLWWLLLKIYQGSDVEVLAQIGLIDLDNLFPAPNTRNSCNEWMNDKDFKKLFLYFSRQKMQKLKSCNKNIIFMVVMKKCIENISKRNYLKSMIWVRTSVKNCISRN